MDPPFKHVILPPQGFQTYQFDTNSKLVFCMKSVFYPYKIRISFGLTV